MIPTVVKTRRATIIGAKSRKVAPKAPTKPTEALARLNANWNKEDGLMEMETLTFEG